MVEGYTPALSSDACSHWNHNVVGNRTVIEYGACSQYGGHVGEAPICAMKSPKSPAGRRASCAPHSSPGSCRGCGCRCAPDPYFAAAAAAASPASWAAASEPCSLSEPYPTAGDSPDAPPSEDGPAAPQMLEPVWLLVRLLLLTEWPDSSRGRPPGVVVAELGVRLYCCCCCCCCCSEWWLWWCSGVERPARDGACESEGERCSCSSC
jgi:hypothetical protein